MEGYIIAYSADATAGVIKCSKTSKHYYFHLKNWTSEAPPENNMRVVFESGDGMALTVKAA